jgi:hypothetical protein
MSSIITENFKILLAKQVYNLLEVGANSYLPAPRKSYVYALMGKQLRWNAGTEVAGTPSDTITYLNDVYKTAIAAKRLSIENASLVAPRINWANSTIYNTYTSNTNFYVLTSKDQVFKCLSNNSGALSTSEPELSLSTTSLEEPFVQTEDGYKWKYMFTLTSIQKQKFLTEEWMPTVFNKFVRAAAEPGSIDIVHITNSGNNYTNGATQSIINISGDGTGAVLKANVSDGKVVNIIIQNRGTNYTYANLSFQDVAGGSGSDAAATVSISPVDGHGYDPVYELRASTILFNVDFEEDESGLIPTNNDFREITLIQNPYLRGTTTLATSNTYSLYTKVKVSPGVGDFSSDEVVYQGTDISTSTFTADVISFDDVENFLYLNNVKGTLGVNQSIKGISSGAIRVVNSVTNPSLELYSGKVLYISDKLPVTRDPSQTERIRFILSF